MPKLNPRLSYISLAAWHLRFYFFRVDYKYRKAVGLAFIGFLLAFPALFDFQFGLQLGLAFIGIILAGWGLVDAIQIIESYAPNNDDHEHVVKEQDTFPTSEGRLRFGDVDVSEQEKLLGFERFAPVGSNESAFSSDRINSWLSTNLSIPFTEGSSLVGKLALCEANSKKWRERLSVLRYFVIQSHTTNELKYCINSIPHPGSVEKLEVKAVSYFDAIITNQCVNLQLYDKPHGTTQTGTLVADLGELYPADMNLAGGMKYYMLSPLSSCSAFANSVGITTLAITKDGYPAIFFEQKAGSVEGQNTMTVIGSGSANHADISFDKADFKNVLRYGMVRELMEEGGLLTHIDANRIQALALENTSVLGFFRWVRRAGKPEFIGVTKLCINFAELKPDSKEVAAWERLTKIPITKFSDFIQLREYLAEESHRRFTNVQKGLGLSSAMVVWRLSQIAEANDDETKALRSRLSKMLEVQDA